MPGILDFVKLASIAKRGSSAWFDFWTNYQSQWMAGGGDPNIPFSKVQEQAYASFQGYMKNPASSTGGGATQRMYGGPGLSSGGFYYDLLASQMRPQTYGTEGLDTLEKTSRLIQSLFDKNVKFGDTIKGILKDEVLLYLGQQASLYQTVNERMAMTGELAGHFRDELMNASPEVIRLGISFDEMRDSVGKLVAESGKFKLLSSDTIREMALASKFTEDMTAFTSMGVNFERIGMGVRDMSLLVEKMGLKSLTLGLNARTTTSLINEHLKNLNQYGFKNGVEGLNRMAQRSVEFRMNMESVFKLADAVWEPDKALELVANLQIIGGAFGDLHDPIKLMYMATNNVEGLQEALIGAAQSLVTYNEEQGRFEVTGANLRRAKEMAQLFGVSMEEMTNIAVAGAERTQAAMDLMGTGLIMPDEDKEFLTNLAQMRDGRMVIEVPEPLREQLGLMGEETELALDEMQGWQAEILLEQKKMFEKMTMEDIARQQVTFIENIQRDVSYLRAVARVWVGNEIGDVLDDLFGANQTFLSEQSKNLTDTIANTAIKGSTIASEFMDETLPKIKEWMNNSKDQIGEMTKSFTKSVKPERAELKSETTPSKFVEREKFKTPEEKPSTIIERKIIDLNLNPLSSSLDQVARIFWSDPRWQDDFKKGFLNPNSN